MGPHILPYSKSKHEVHEESSCESPGMNYDKTPHKLTTPSQKRWRTFLSLLAISFTWTAAQLFAVQTTSPTVPANVHSPPLVASNKSDTAWNFSGTIADSWLKKGLDFPGWRSKASDDGGDGVLNEVDLTKVLKLDPWDQNDQGFVNLTFREKLARITQWDNYTLEELSDHHINILSEDGLVEFEQLVNLQDGTPDIWIREKIGEESMEHEATASIHEKKASLRSSDVDGQVKQPEPVTSYTPVPPRYTNKPMYILYRTIGNDLPPRHVVGQSYNNVRFILDNEPEFEGMEKRWLLNRILNKTEEERIIGLLKEYKQTYVRLPFRYDDYYKQPLLLTGYDWADVLRSKYFARTLLRLKVYFGETIQNFKNLYAINNNGARNYMIEDGIASGATWILPFDGNCFISQNSWNEVLEGIQRYGNQTKYFLMPMARILNNEQVLDPEYRPNATDEPQIVFRSDARERFNVWRRYGHRSKVDLIMRLGVPGPWEHWDLYSTNDNLTYSLSTDVPGNNSVPKVSYVYRLFSGRSTMEVAATGESKRAVSRGEGVGFLFNRIEAIIAEEMYGYSWKRLLMYNETVLAKEKLAYQQARETGVPVPKSHKHYSLVHRIDELVSCADQALLEPIHSVMNKVGIPPSNDKHDYFTPSPYYWPNPNTKTGLPFIAVKNYRQPGTLIYTKRSNYYDRDALSSFIGNTTCLALAWYFTEDAAYAQRGAVNVRSWFLEPTTAMNPHLRYAQLRGGHRNSMGASAGAVETKDFYYLLDAVRLLLASGELSSTSDLQGLRGWFREFRRHLLTTLQGAEAYMAANHIGVHYELQVAAISSFLNEFPLFYKHTEFAKGRMLGQFAEDGSLWRERDRKLSLHYQLVGLQAWFDLARIGSNAGMDLWRFTTIIPEPIFYDIPTAINVGLEGENKETGNQEPNTTTVSEQQEVSRRNDVPKGASGPIPILFRGAAFLLPQLNCTKTTTRRNEEVQTEDMERFWPLYHAVQRYYTREEILRWTTELGLERCLTSRESMGLYDVKGRFSEYDGVQLYWNVGLSDEYL